MAHVEVVQKKHGYAAICALLVRFFSEEEHFEDWLETLERLPAEKSYRLSNLYERKLGECFSSPPTPLFTICCFGLLGVFQNSMVKDSLDLEQKNKNGTSGLYLAARRGHTEIVHEMLMAGVSPNAPGNQYGTALQAASFAGHTDIVKMLLEKGARISGDGGEYSSPIQAALANNHEDVANVFLDAGFQFTDHNQLNDALETASFRGQVSIVQKLLEGRAGEVVIEDESRRPDPLQVALYGGKARKARDLLQSCADINEQKGYFSNALAAAIAGPTVALVKEVVAKGAKLDQRGRFGYPLRAAAVAGKLEVVKYILEIGRESGAGVDPNVADEELGDALQAAASRGDCDVMLLLLSHGADVNGSGGFFKNTLQAASFGGHEQAVRLLLEYGAEHKDIYGCRIGRYRDAVQAAVYGGHEHLVTFLLEKGASLNPCRLGRCYPFSVSFETKKTKRYALPAEKDGTGQLDVPTEVGPLEIAARCGNVGLLRVLIGRGAIIDAPDAYREDKEWDSGCAFTALQIAAFWGHTEAVTCLLDAGADVNTVRQTMGTPLQAALEGSRLDIAKMLLMRGADIDKHWMMFGSSLQVYAERGNLGLVKFLHELGANINDKGGDNGTALQVACDAGHLDVVTYLLDNGAEINAPGALVGPALQAAATNGHGDIVELLLNRGAEVEDNENGIGSPLQGAAANGHDKIVRLLPELQRGKSPRVDSGVREEELHDDDSNSGPANPTTNSPIGPPLHLAAWYGHESVVRMLIELGADVHEVHRPPAFQSGTSEEWSFSEKQGTALWMACIRGHTNIAQTLFLHDPSGYINRGSLMSAVKASLTCGKDELAVMLVHEGMYAGLQYEQFADLVDQTSNEGRIAFLEQVLESHPLDDLTRALYEASRGGRSRVVELLVKKGVNVNSRDEEGDTALVMAWKEREKHRNIYWTSQKPDWIGVIGVLANAGANMADLKGEAHHIAVAAMKEGNLAVLELLANGGFELFPDAEHYSTVLAQAAEGFHVKLVKWLCQYRTPTAAVLERALSSAVQKNRKCFHHNSQDSGTRLETVQALLDVKVPFNVTEDGALHIAARNGHAEVVELLLQYTMLPTRNAVIERTLEEAIRSGQLDCLKVLFEALEEAPVKKQQLCTRAIVGTLPSKLDKVLESVLSQGVDPNLRTGSKDGTGTLLYHSAKSGNIKAVRMLLQHGADIHLTSAGPYGTALHAAAAEGCTQVAELLLVAGADPDSRNQDNHTPLILSIAGKPGYCTARKGSVCPEWRPCAECCFQLLLNYGADIDAVIMPLGTTLAVAARRGKREAVKILLERGADPTVKLVGEHAYGCALEAAREANTENCEECQTEKRISQRRRSKSEGIEQQQEIEFDGRNVPTKSSENKKTRGCKHIIQLLLDAGAVDVDIQ